MGTIKQADALVRTARKAGKILTAEQVELVRAQVLAATHAEIQAKFAELNAVTGFTRTGRASDAQLVLIGQLERKLFGAVIPIREKLGLTFEEADTKIKNYNALLQMEKAA